MRVFLFAATIAWGANLPLDAAPIQAQVVRGRPIQLFDGETLKGWGQQNGTPSKNWVVDDGSIAWQASGGDLYHDHWYRDFELSFEWKLKDGGNSGVKYRVQKYGNQHLGCEYQIFDDPQSASFTKQSTGSLYALFEPNQKKVVQPTGHWNQSRIVVCGQHVEHWLNGIQVVDAHPGDPIWNSRVASSKFNQYDRFGLNREGRIFLQDHGNPVWFRAITVTPLDCDTTTQLPSCHR